MTFGIVLNLVAGSYPQVVLNCLNPVITWLLIKSNWREWAAIDQENWRQKQEYYKATPDSMYWDNGKKHKIWAIINTCLLFVFVFPLAMSIPAIIQSNKAQKAPSKEAFDRSIKRALIFNICTYPCIALFVVTMILAT